MLRRPRLLRASAPLVGLALSLFVTTARAQATDDGDAGSPDASPTASEGGPAARPDPDAGAAPAASTPAPPPEKPAPPPPPKPASGESPKRALPDYDGRGDPPTTAGDVALWVPRVLLSPLYFTTEYLIRRPLGWLITTAEQNQWPSAIKNVFVFGPDKKAGVVPTAFLDLGFRASVGVYAFWDDLLGPGNHLRLHASTFGLDWLQGALADRIPLGKDTSIDLRVEGVHRPDQLFAGFGPRTLESDRMRYGIDRFLARPVFETEGFWRSSRVLVEAGFNAVRFREDACCDDPSIEARVREGRAVLPPAYDTGYTAFYQRGEIVIDTREPRPANQTGLRLETYVEQGANARKTRSTWVKYGATAGGILDLKNNRTVSLSLATLFVDPLTGGGEIPFTEQVVLGGSGPMRGYLYGRLTDRSAAVMTLKYKWPIWVFLDGAAQVAMGNVFGAHLDDFPTRLLRMSAAIGIESVGRPDHTFEVLTGFGTETIDNGFQVSSVRLLFGTNRGF